MSVPVLRGGLADCPRRALQTSTFALWGSSLEKLSHTKKQPSYLLQKQTGCEKTDERATTRFERPHAPWPVRTVGMYTTKRIGN